MINPLDSNPIRRRAVLLGLGGGALAAVLAACGDSSSSPGTIGATSPVDPTSTPTTQVNGSPSDVTATAPSNSSCVLTPEMTEGPYYLDIDLVRADIAEGRPGSPLALTLGVIDVTTCQPIPDAAVDVWHADAAGAYSGVSGDDGTFMRGTLITDAAGQVTFATRYPGWYRGRTVHIHVMVHVGGDAVHTGQLFFDDTFTDTVYAAEPYASRPTRSTRNADDSIYGAGGTLSTLPVTSSGDGYAATLTMAVHA